MDDAALESDLPPRDDARSRIVAAAAALVAAGGEDAATTRAIAEAAAVQAPTIYRLFGDKAGLMEAVAERAHADFVASKVAREPHPDPVEDLRQGWDDYVGFNLAHPAVFLLTTARQGPLSKAAAAGLAVLGARVRRVAAAGRLRVPEELAVDLIHAMGSGAVMTLLRKPPAERADLAEAARDAVFAAVMTDGAPPLGEGPGAAASALRARLDETTDLSAAERQLLSEWLLRIAGR